MYIIISFELTGTITLNYLLNCIGLDNIKEKLRSQRALIDLDARWRIEIGLTSNDPEVGDSEPGVFVFLIALPTKKEIQELSNIWSRSVKATISFLIKSIQVQSLVREQTVLLLLWV
jgi:hypothetical protein